MYRQKADSDKPFPVILQCKSRLTQQEEEGGGSIERRRTGVKLPSQQIRGGLGEYSI